MQNNNRFTGAYAPMQAYVAPIRPQLWRLLVGAAMMLLIYMIGITLFFLAAGPTLMGSDTLGGDPLGLIVVLGSFAFMGLAVAVATLWPARRPLISLIGPLPAAWSDFRRVMAAAAMVIAAGFVTSLWLDPTITPNMPLAQILPWLAPMIIALAIQITAEELVFRGYIMGQLAARFASPWIWMVLPAALFGLLHYDGAVYGDTAWIVCAATAIFALIASDLTARTGNLGAAIALHFANNFFAMVLIGETGKLDGVAIYTAPMDLTDPITLASGLVFVALMWLAARVALRV